MLQIEENRSLSTDGQNGEYLMIESLHAENFRCFKSLDLVGLRRINIIVGKNASGKTALLETIKLGLDGVPNIVPWMNQLRSTPTIMVGNPTPEQFQAQFMDLFYDFDVEGKISVSINDSDRRTATVLIYFDPKRAITNAPPSLGFRQPAALQQPITITPLTFNRTDFHGQKSTLLATIGPQGQPHFQPGKSLGISSSLIANLNYGGPGENAAWLSQLSVQKRNVEVIEAVQRHFRFISNLTSESIMPGAPGIVYADLPALSRKVPISLVSGGISRLVTMILAIVTYARGVVLIDEIENGIFHDQYVSLWKTVLDLAKHHNTQLFISTHSKECLVGAVQAIATDPSSFALLRVRRDDGQSAIEVFGGEQTESALEKNGEVRN